MDNEVEIIGYDGTDEIIYSKSFNVYENRLEIRGIPGFPDRNFNFVFQTSEPEAGQNDIDVIWENQQANITISRRFRNTLGSGTIRKLVIMRTDNNGEILLSIFGQQVGEENMLSVTVNFYRR